MEDGADCLGTSSVSEVLWRKTESPVSQQRSSCNCPRAFQTTDFALVFRLSFVEGQLRGFLGHHMMTPGKEAGRETDAPWQGSMKSPHPISVCAQMFTPHSEHMANSAHTDKGGGFVGK